MVLWKLLNSIDQRKGGKFMIQVDKGSYKDLDIFSMFGSAITRSKVITSRYLISTEITWNNNCYVTVYFGISISKYRIIQT